MDLFRAQSRPPAAWRARRTYSARMPSRRPSPPRTQAVRGPPCRFWRDPRPPAAAGPAGHGAAPARPAPPPRLQRWGRPPPCTGAPPPPAAPAGAGPWPHRGRWPHGRCRAPSAARPYPPPPDRPAAGRRSRRPGRPLRTKAGGPPAPPVRRPPSGPRTGRRTLRRGGAGWAGRPPAPCRRSRSARGPPPRCPRACSAAPAGGGARRRW